VLLLGVGHGNNTSLHLSEYRAENPSKHETTGGAPQLVDGRREWSTLRDIEIEDDDFERIGARFVETGAVSTGQVGIATAQLMSQRALVDFGAAWMTACRP